jgi:hypothetical protein
MKCIVRPTHARGTVLSQRDLRGAPEHKGELLVVQRTDEALRRSLRVACLQHLGSEPKPLQALPPLYDVQLLWMGTEGFALSGFERLQGRADGYIAYAQSWWVRPL